MQTTCTEDGRVLEDQESPHDLVALLVEEDGTTVPETDPAEDRAKELEDLIRTITVDLLSLKNQEKYDPRGSSNAERGIQDVLNRIKKVIP